MKIIFWLVLVLMASTLYQYISVKIDRKKYGPLGEMVEIGGHLMHIYGTGLGSPTVVMTAGLGTASGVVDYYLIQKEVAKHTRSVVYERPGYGWSDYTSAPRTIEQVTKEMDLLLKANGEKPPYILVGHSMGSLEMLHYAQKNPDKVIGIVIIDGGSPEYYKDFRLPPIFTVLTYFIKFATVTGIIRLLGNLNSILNTNKRLKDFPLPMRKIANMLFYHKLFNKNSIDELKLLNENAKKVFDKGIIGDIPLVILTAEKSNLDRVSAQKWFNTQERFKELSSTSTQFIVKDSTHNILLEKPDIIVKEILKIKDLYGSC